MRLAFLAWSPLVPADSGYRLRAQALLRHLPAEELLLIAPAPEVEGLRHCVLPSPWTARLPLPLNRQVLLFQGPTQARRRAVQALRDFRPDLIWAEGLWAFPPAWDYRQETDVPVVLGVQNIESIAARKRGRATPRSLLLQRLERRAYRRADYLVACSTTDAEQLAWHFDIPAERILVLPNGVYPFPQSDDTGWDFETVPDENEKLLLFIGKRDYGPNKEAIQWILRDLIPELGNLPHPIGVLLVGFSGSLSAFYHHPHNVRLYLAGRVVSTEPYLRRADLCIAPLFSGSGTRIKILEYLSAGKPVVATRKAVEGLELEPGTHYEAAESASQMAETIGRLLDNPQQALEIALQGKSLVEERYLWPRLITRFYKDLQRLVAR